MARSGRPYFVVMGLFVCHNIVVRFILRQKEIEYPTIHCEEGFVDLAIAPGFSAELARFVRGQILSSDKWIRHTEQSASSASDQDAPSSYAAAVWRRASSLLSDSCDGKSFYYHARPMKDYSCGADFSQMQNAEISCRSCRLG